ncbi:phosphatidylinositol-specific phospholipase C1-like protein [Phenylobacterium sp. J367]|uniref:phosphatidylinositol-specific phospholipase C1-like protein n=1 Tax=Phenylobacterium sp. J367 TaxID=2898435 RepID=UPI002151F70A|nr:phosphatidylinositol-specific phospholipase C1-like protein [Phenylobacterium sp. J367]MCR5879111.1 phosphatidylinositol-specific phospholipase C1-like protein [Phenylobacterium sp. J367]
MNALQAVGTHNSYKLAIAPKEMALLRAANPRTADTLDYSHRPLAAQLDDGARQLEIDLLLDPETGRYADPVFHRLAKDGDPYDFTALRKPGLKVLHAQDVDYRAVCNLFADCLGEIRAWSQAHPDHVPLLILLNLKEGPTGVPGGVVAPVFDAAAMDRIDAEIRAAFPETALITPDSVRGRHPTLKAAVAAGAWPTLGAARGKVMFACDCPPEQVARYLGDRPSLEGRAAFVNIGEDAPAAAYITLNEPVEQQARIAAAVRAGLIVRTRADADTVEARTGDRRRQAAAFASGAQYVSTDYMQPDPRFPAYTARLPGGGVARISPARSR